MGVETGLYLFTKDADIKKHIAYAAAKTGDIPAAMRFITDLALNFIYQHRTKFLENHLFGSPLLLQRATTFSSMM